MTPFSQYLQDLFAQIKEQLPYFANNALAEFRENGMQLFQQQDFSDFKKENPSVFNERIATLSALCPQLTPPPYRPVEEFFHCKVKDMDTQMYIFENGWYVHQQQPLTVEPNGVIIGSLCAALRQFPQLVFPHLLAPAASHEDSLALLNRALFCDGLFVYVPDNVIVEKPIQLISLTNSDQELLLHHRNLLIIGKNAQLSFLQCDDSLQFKPSFINNVTKIFLEENAILSYYKMENKNPESLLFNEVEVQQKAHSQFRSNAMTFNTGYLRNKIHVALTEPFAATQMHGLYLVDKKQHVDNQIFIDHQVEDCQSFQLYKGIVDDQAVAQFLGHVLVRQDSQRTVASQTNRNIALTDAARVTSKPFLEIYADDVKCNHGTTVGQLDENALYYLRTRGICEVNARRLLMLAFANEIADTIAISSLQARYKEMIRKRLNGELSICDQCVLRCPHFQ